MIHQRAPKFQWMPWFHKAPMEEEYYDFYSWSAGWLWWQFRGYCK